MNDSAKNILIFVAIVLVLMTVVQSFNGAGMAGAQQERYSDFLNRVEDNSVESVSFDGPTVRYMTKNGSRFFAYNPESGDVSALIGELQERGASGAGCRIRHAGTGTAEPARNAPRPLIPSTVADRRLDLFHAPDARRRCWRPRRNVVRQEQGTVAW